jgi:hypothetical protein
MTVLETARTRLRQFDESDVDNRVELGEDGSPGARERAKGTLVQVRHGCKHGYGEWAAVDRTTDRFIGSARLFPLHPVPCGLDCRIVPALRRRARWPEVAR